MDYENKHREEITRATQLWECGDITRENLEYIFPELKESEDERIRNGLIALLKFSLEDGSAIAPGFNETKEQALTWLEKQGEKRSKLVDFDYNTNDSDLQEVTYFIPNGFHAEIDGNKVVIKQGEPKPAVDFRAEDWYVSKVDGKIHNIYNSGVEPKFKVGNWYQCTKDFFGKGVTFDKNTAYYCAKEGCLQNEYGCHIAIVKDLYDNFKLWTIADAKEGDVLAWDDNKCIALFKNIYDEDSFNSHGFVGHCTGAFESRLSYHDIKGAHPAIKEQRDILFSKMHKAGYIWDAEKKELKEIKNSPILSNSSNTGKQWSEEDDYNVQCCIAKAESDIANGCTGRNKELIDWLKSLKQRMEGKV